MGTPDTRSLLAELEALDTVWKRDQAGNKMIRLLPAIIEALRRGQEAAEAWEWLTEHYRAVEISDDGEYTVCGVDGVCHDADTPLAAVLAARLAREEEGK